MTTEWLLLVLVAPAILIPVVLLWGFAGCGAYLEDPGAQRPTNLRATGISRSVISVTWDNPNSVPVTFLVERTKEGESEAKVLSAAAPFDDDDPGLQEATTYLYRARAIRLQDNNISGLSEQAAGRTIGVAFEAALTTDQPGLEGFTLVQRIEPTRLRDGTLPGDILTPGARVRITVRGSTTGNLTLDRIYISQPAVAGDLYDSAADLTQVASGVVVPATTAFALPLIVYDLDRTKPLLIAFDISATAGNGRFVTGVPATDATLFFRPATSEASIPDRSPSSAAPGASAYSSSPSVFLVERIEVV